MLGYMVFNNTEIMLHFSAEVNRTRIIVIRFALVNRNY